MTPPAARVLPLPSPASGTADFSPAASRKRFESVWAKPSRATAVEAVALDPLSLLLLRLRFHLSPNLEQDLHHILLGRHSITPFNINSSNDGEGVV